MKEELETVQHNADKSGKNLQRIKEVSLSQVLVIINFIWIQFESRWVESVEDSSQDEENAEKQKELLKQHDEELRDREKAIVTKDIDEKGREN